jgi:seryl-tRNA synthetase
MTEKKPRLHDDVIDLIQRVTALENTTEAHHSEIMRILAQISSDVKDSRENAQDMSTEIALNKKAIESTDEKVEKVDSKINRMMSGAGALILAIIGGAITIISRLFINS